jgi:outer membrane protein OmpA-like peptidoglycan-associated protein
MPMRYPLLLVVFLLLTQAASRAQVTIDLRALEGLPNTPPPPPAASPPPPAPRPAARPAPSSQTAAAASAGSSARPTVPPTAPSTAPSPPPATLPTAAPATVSLAPVSPPAPQATPVPPPPVSTASATTAAPGNAGLRLAFKAEESDLSPDANAAIGKLVKAMPRGDTISYNVVAYATGGTDDPSIARRLSLSRGLAVRSALIADGVPSTRIYVRALGAGGGDGPPDRVDLTVLGTSGAGATAKP